MSVGRWDQLASWHRAWLTADADGRTRLRARLAAEQPELLADADQLAAADQASLQGFLETPAFVIAAQEIARESVEMTAGTSVGPYRIVALLARGGMGDVYRATDIRLHRDVALKVMAHVGPAGSGQVERFLQEARVTASLDHQNVVRVYDVGVVDGRPYLVEELLEGETLRARLSRGELRVAEVRTIAIEVSGGLVAAHAAGLVHRDLKPENIFLTRNGVTKILDFGIAKLGPDAAVPGGPSTLPGVLLGTAGYLAPEQVTGAPVDARADLFALGAILFEALSGRRAFAREHTIDTLYAIRHDAAPDLLPLRGDVPPALADAVARLLEKAPASRFQSSADLLWALEHLHEGPSDIRPGGRTPAGRPTEGHAAFAARAAVVAAALAAAGALVGVAFWWRPTLSPQFERLTFRTGIVENARFVPGTEDILYSAAWAGDSLHVYSTRPGALDSRSVIDTTAVLRDVASNGELLIGTGDNDLGTLAVAPATGRGLRGIEAQVGGASWGHDGTIAVVRTANGRNALEYPAGRTLYESGGVLQSMRISPDGERVGFIEYASAGASRGMVVVVDRQGSRRVLSEGWGDINGLAWSADGSELYFSAAPSGAGTSVRAVRINGDQRVVLAAPGAVTLHDVARDGRMLVSRDDPRLSVWLVRDGKRAEDLSWFDWGFPAVLTPDGSMLLLGEIGSGGGADGALFLRPTNGDAAVRLGSGRGLDISPDRKWVLVLNSGRLQLLPTGPGQVVELTSAEGLSYRAGQFLPGGRHLLVGVSAPDDKQGVYLRSLDDHSHRFITRDLSTRIVISPAGDLLAFLDRKGVMVVHSLSAGRRRTLEAARSGDIPMAWSEDGRYVLAQTLGGYRSVTAAGRSSAMCTKEGGRVEIFRIDTEANRRELDRVIQSEGPAFSCMGRILMSRDGKTLAYHTTQLTSDLYLVRFTR
jgi:hypothetical protein